ncbi:MAG: HAD-IIA family hydrolase [Acidimicrobiales bacterium]
MTVWALDLDGVVWRGEQPIAGSVAGVLGLVERGDRVVLVSNNSAATIREYRAKLALLGLPREAELVTSAMAAATLIAPGERVLVCGGAGIAEALERRGATALGDDGDHEALDAVIVGLHRAFDYERLRRAAAAVRSGARLVATNDDATYPTADGLVPGAGAILAAVERASGAKAVVAGKPYPAIVALVRASFGAEGTVVGDRPDTDGRFARALGWRFALVLSGVTIDAAGADPRPDVIAKDLATLIATTDAR